ncbi:MAG: hypothetical protein PHV68_00285 [Candidatus Gastranaerophilales bacterium]|nr:hypothetical protein [Candidatus Gastranaerophilales bacterium]
MQTGLYSSNNLKNRIFVTPHQVQNSSFFLKKSDFKENFKIQNSLHSLSLPLNYYTKISFSGKETIPTGQNFLNDYRKVPVSKEKSVEKFILNIIENTGEFAQGGEAAIYNIPNMNKYLLRVTLGYNEIDFKNDQTKKIKIMEDNIGKEGINVGQPIAKLGNDIKVILKVPGESYHKNGHTDLLMLDYLDEKDYNNRINLLSKMPLKVYENLVEILVKLNKMGHSIDPAPENILIEDFFSINIIDVNYNSGIKNNCVDVMRALIDDIDNIEEYADRKNSAKIEKIIKNCIKACEKKEVLLYSLKEKTAFMRYLDFYGVDVKI